jgi:4-oxalmesaconate hydratase
MIIDVHGHYTTAPPALGAWRDLQIAARSGAGHGQDA